MIKEINFLLRNSIKENAERINKLKSKWIIDTIVIDPAMEEKILVQ